MKINFKTPDSLSSNLASFHLDHAQRDDDPGRGEVSHHLPPEAAHVVPAAPVDAQHAAPERDKRRWLTTEDRRMRTIRYQYLLYLIGLFEVGL